MKAALIPARGLESFALLSDFHMALAIPDCMENWHYVKVYQEAADRHDYIVLDNGAADGGLVSNFHLMSAARKLGADEIVLPDVFYDKAKTVIAVREFIKWYQTDPKSPLTPNLKFMAVAQGTNIIAFRNCIDVFASIPEISVVGLPRHMLTTLNQKAARIDFANWIAEKYGSRFEIHLLGTHPVWLKEIVSVAKYADHVRSVDSALPFNYALASLDLATTKVELTRNPEYFNLDWYETVSTKRLNANIKTFMEWSNGINGTSTPQGELRSVSTVRSE